MVTTPLQTQVCRPSRVTISDPAQTEGIVTQPVSALHRSTGFDARWAVQGTASTDLLLVSLAVFAAAAVRSRWHCKSLQGFLAWGSNTQAAMAQDASLVLKPQQVPSERDQNTKRVTRTAKHGKIPSSIPWHGESSELHLQVPAAANQRYVREHMSGLKGP